MVNKNKGKSVGVSVFARFRPCTTDKHIKDNTEYNFEIVDGKSIKLGDKDLFNFDVTFKDSTNQEQIFKLVGEPIVNDLMAGYNGTVFAYGQTASGKTHSLFGDMSNRESEKRGIIPRACAQIFDYIESAKDVDECVIKASFIEIYLDKLQDLLNPNGSKLKIRQRRNETIYVEGVCEEYVSSFKDIYNLLKIGFRNRAVASTKMNKESSRSHAVLILNIKQTMCDGTIKLSKVNFADLAGSEKVKKTGATGNTFDQAKAINLSLSALGNVISALTASKKRQHIPYRDSKLTWLLKDSLGGNTKTSLIVTCSSDEYNFQETLSTLRFAKRAKEIKNNVSVNEQTSMKELHAMIEIYKTKLGEANSTIIKLNTILAKMRSASNEFENFGAEIDEILKNANIETGDDDDDDERNGDDVVEILDNLKTRISASDDQIDSLRETINELNTRKFSQNEEMEKMREEKDDLVQRLSRLSQLDQSDISLIVDEEEIEEKDKNSEEDENEKKMNEYVGIIESLKSENDAVNNDREILLMWNEEMKEKLDKINANAQEKEKEEEVDEISPLLIRKSKVVKPIRKSVLRESRNSEFRQIIDDEDRIEMQEAEIQTLKDELQEMTAKYEKVQDKLYHQCSRNKPVYQRMMEWFKMKFARD